MHYSYDPFNLVCLLLHHVHFVVPAPALLLHLGHHGHPLLFLPEHGDQVQLAVATRSLYAVFFVQTKRGCEMRRSSVTHMIN